MEIKKSKLNHLTANGTWVSPDKGTFYKFEMGFEDGITGQYLSNKYTNIAELWFKIGDEIDYEFTDGKYPKIKPFKPNAGGKFTPKSREEKLSIVYQNALTQANSFVGFVGFTNSSNKENSLNELLNYADIIAQFVIKKSGL